MIANGLLLDNVRLLFAMFAPLAQLVTRFDIINLILFPINN